MQLKCLYTAQFYSSVDLNEFGFGFQLNENFNFGFGKK